MKESKKWDTGAERDLCMAMIMGNQDSERVKYNWQSIHAFMTVLGHSFTKDAISQHYNKTMLKDFKTRHGGALATPKKTETAAKENGDGSTPTPTPTPRKRAPKGKKAAARSAAEDDDDDLGNPGDVPALQSPAKRLKLEDGQDEQKGIRTESA